MNWEIIQEANNSPICSAAACGVDVSAHLRTKGTRSGHWARTTLLTPALRAPRCSWLWGSHATWATTGRSSDVCWASLKPWAFRTLLMKIGTTWGQTAEEKKRNYIQERRSQKVQNTVVLLHRGSFSFIFFSEFVHPIRGVVRGGGQGGQGGPGPPSILGSGPPKWEKLKTSTKVGYFIVCS